MAKTKRAIQPAYLFLREDGVLVNFRPRDGSPYKVIVYDLKRYEDACRSGDAYYGLGGEITDNRKVVA